MLSLNCFLRLKNLSKLLIASFSEQSDKRSTIFALSSGHGKCGVSVIRVSGPRASIALKALTTLKKLPQPRTALLRKIINPLDKEVIDKGLILWFPGPKSFTGEDSCEFQVHGGLAVVNGVLGALQSINLRPAEAGEFTKRAFMNGKLDLTEVEGLADLLSAETELQRKQAFLQSEGYLSKIYKGWREDLLKNLAHIEAFIDFDETDELQDNTLKNIVEKVKKLTEDINSHLIDGCKGERLRNGVKVVIVGETNAGKSSFFNILCKKPASIVTPVEGTTRDALEINADINGFPVILTDTAGLRSQTTDIVEQEGIRRSISHLNEADLILLLIDIQKILESPYESISKYVEKVQNEINFNIENKQKLIVLNKIDLLESKKIKLEDLFAEEKFVLTSCKTKKGFNEVIDQITEKLRMLCTNPSKEHPSMTHIRHRKHLSDCVICLQKFQERINTSDIVLLAEELRKASYHLAHLTGQVTNEHVLEIIFKDFCIGK